MRERAAAVLVALALVPSAGADDLRGLISACADGDLAMCRQLEDGRAGAESGSPTLDALAEGFAARAPALGLAAADGVPRLAAAYGEVVADYFAHPRLAEQRARWYLEQRIPGCARHYADTWLHERNWWPTDADGGTDWRLVYLHVLDHYFGYCVREGE